MADDERTEVIVAAVALVVSLVALLATFMQVLQQYYASAAGYSQCNDKVIGAWAQSKKRRFRWEELRFEVIFDSPVIFVSPPKNKNGPVPDEPIHFIEGTDESHRKTLTTTELSNRNRNTTVTSASVDPREEYMLRTIKERVHTADNERATWFNLLVILQKMESLSSNWQEELYRHSGPPYPGLAKRAPTLKEAHTFTVAVQRKRKSWDTMPPSVVRPYATTAMCHLIEMTAALGMYWKEFNRQRDRYRAEGNGFMMLGERVSDVGLMFSFQVNGKYQFEHNRVIPVDEIKELCFGYVLTIYCEKSDNRRLEFPNNGPENLSIIQMSSRSEIAETLLLMGCNNNTINYFRKEGSRTSHLFPISFEILGFLSRTYHIYDSGFTYIPNPTPDRWDKRSLSLINLLEYYKKYFRIEIQGADRNSFVISRIDKHLEAILVREPDNSKPVEKLLLLKALHEAIDDTDEILTGRSKAAPKTSVANATAQSLPHHKVSKSNGLLGQIPAAGAQDQRAEMVQDVLRSHIESVLRLLNDRGGEAQSLKVPDQNPSSPVTETPSHTQSTFEDMDSASSDERQEIFMKIYFERVRRTVIERALSSATRRASIISATSRPPATSHNQSRNEATSPVEASPAVNEVSPRPDVTVERPQAPLWQQQVSHDDIWCTFVFRMICWLMLHDFDKSDVQISKSELRGSRMPVFIA